MPWGGPLSSTCSRRIHLAYCRGSADGGGAIALTCLQTSANITLPSGIFCSVRQFCGPAEAWAGAETAAGAANETAPGCCTKP